MKEPRDIAIRAREIITAQGGFRARTIPFDEQWDDAVAQAWKELRPTLKEDA